MSDVESPNGRPGDAAPQDGILAALPRTRPQRTSPRRAAARAASSVSTQAVAAAAKRPATERAPGKPRTAVSGSSRPVTTKTKTNERAAATAKAPAKAKRKPVRPRPPASAVHKPAEPAVPKQGYEPEEELELGSTVNPPSGVELVESVADIVSEIASSGLAASGRILKDAFSLLRRP